MNSRERVLAACAHRTPDRTPLDYWARADVTAGLMKYLGLDSIEALYQRLGVDLRTAGVGERRPEFDEKTTGVLGGASAYAGRRYIIHEDGSFEDAWGIVRKQGEDGLYDEWVSGPFIDSTDLDAYPWPGMDIYEEVDGIRGRVEAHGGRYAVLGAIDLPFKVCWHLRGLENFLCDMLIDQDFASDLLIRAAGYEKEKGLRLTRAGVDIVGVYGDIAMQRGMMVQPRAWRKIEKPVFAEMIAAFKSVNPELLVFYHSDGDISEVLPDLIEIGVDIVNPIQPECMDPAEVKRLYGDRLTMHGTISIQRTLPKGSPDDVRREVLGRIEKCGKDGGLIICPSNLLQPDTPFENILALYDAVIGESG